MDIISFGQDQADLSITHGELLILNNALNEICSGIALFEFQTRIGSERADVLDLLETVGSLLSKMES